MFPKFCFLSLKFESCADFYAFYNKLKKIYRNAKIYLQINFRHTISLSKNN